MIGKDLCNLEEDGCKNNNIINQKNNIINQKNNIF